MQNFDFKRGGKKCSKTERVLQPGETFYSALIEQGDDTERLDFCEQAWDGPPEDCLGWWKSKIPEVTEGKIYWAPRDVQMAYFDHVAGQPSHSDVAYVMALLLIQKKWLAVDEGLEEPDESVLRLKNRDTKDTYEIPVVQLSPDRVKQIQDELAERLFTDQPEPLDELGEEAEAD